MTTKILRSLLAIVLTLVVVFPCGIVSRASELQDDMDSSEIPIEIGEISIETIDETNIPERNYNVISRPYLGEIPHFDEIAPYSDENTNPNAAYLFQNNTSGSGTFTTSNEERWYAFVLQEKSKVSIHLDMDASMDADVYVFSLDSAEGTLAVIGGSTNSALGESEFYTAVLDGGTYFVGIVNYTGIGTYEISYYETTVDVNYEVNDSFDTATNITFNDKMVGVIDCPYDKDLYKFTVSKYTWVRMLGKFPGKFELEVVGATTGSTCNREGKTGNLYVFSPGTYWFMVSSKDGGYSSTVTYDITFDKVYEAASRDSYLMTGISSKDGIEVKQSIDGRFTYVNGNMVDINYLWTTESSCHLGSHAAIISIDQNENVYCSSDIQEVHFTQSTHPIQKYFQGTALKMTFTSTSDFYKIHWVGTGIFSGETRECNSSAIIVLINPADGKLVDICSPNYYYTLNNDGTNGITMFDRGSVIWQ